MTGPEHYRRAEQLIESITSKSEFGIQIAKDPELIAAAQTHAVVALAAATTLGSDSRSGSTSPVPR
jgi:hypothetical protein